MSGFESREGYAVRRGDHGRSGLHILATRLSRAHCFMESEPDRRTGAASKRMAAARRWASTAPLSSLRNLWKACRRRGSWP
jgi:hypothetical protein